MSKENDLQMIESFLKFDENIKAAQQYIKETYHIDSEFSDEDNILYIWSPNINESLNLASAKEYICQTIGNEMIDIIYGEKQ